MAKCALWGLRGRTPCKVLCTFAFFFVLARTAPASRDVGCDCIVSEPPPPSRRLRALSRPRRRCRPNFVALRLLLFLGCSRIFTKYETVEHF